MLRFTVRPGIAFANSVVLPGSSCTPTRLYGIPERIINLNCRWACNTSSPMARTKLPPKKIIQKENHKVRSMPLAHAYVRELENAIPVQVFASDRRVRGEVLRLSTTLPKTEVVPHVETTSDVVENGYTSSVTQVATPNTTHFVLLPGNPGVVEYYRQFLSLMQARLPQDVRDNVEIHALGLPGHDFRQLNGDTTYGIKEHTEYVLSYLTSGNIRPSLTESSLVLVGHSYGAFLSLQVLDMLTPDVVSRTSLVFAAPCVWNMEQCAGPVSSFLLRNPFQLTTSSAWLITKLLPKQLRDGLVRLQQYAPLAESATMRFVDHRRWALYRNVCALAQDEMQTIRALRQYPALSSVAARTFVICANEDRWCPPGAVDVMKEAFGPKLTVEYADKSHLKGITHSFVLHTDQCEKVARVVSGWITEIVRSHCR